MTEAVNRPVLSTVSYRESTRATTKASPMTLTDTYSQKLMNKKRQNLSLGLRFCRLYYIGMGLRLINARSAPVPHGLGHP